MIRALAAIVVLLIACASIWYVADAIYGSPLRAADTQIAGLAEQVDALAAREVAARRKLDATPQTGNLIAAVFDDGSLAVEAASARLQESVRGAVAAAGGIPTSSQSVITPMDEHHSKLTVVLHARFDERGLLSFLRAVESERPLALIDALDVRQMPVAGAEQSLDVTATIVKFHADLAQN